MARRITGVNALNGLTSFLHNSGAMMILMAIKGVNALNGLTSFLPQGQLCIG